MKSDRQVHLEFGIEQRDKIIRELLIECGFLRRVVQTWVRRGLSEVRRQSGLQPLGRRLSRTEQRILRELRG